jgi:pimeloyl-ACP methyl ester carboxylesterase
LIQLVARIVAKVPTRILWGRGDPYIPERYAHGFSGAHLTVLEHAGHWVPISAPKEVAEAIRALS